MALHRRADPLVLPQEVVRAVFLSLFTLLLVNGMAQDISAMHKDHSWPNEAAWSPEWSATAKRTEILSDDLSIRLRNTKPQFLTLFFERHQVIRFASEADILKHGRFVLPESLDPPYDQRLTPWNERVGPARPLWYNVRLDHFAARIIRPDGTSSELSVLGHIERQEVKTVRSMESAWSYVIELQSVAPGDVVEVSWKYAVPYSNNWNATQGWRAYEWMDNWARLTSWRVFFHGVLPIRKQQISLKYNLKHGIVCGGAVADSVKTTGNEVLRSWNRELLPGCMDEVNARPAADLPFITVMLATEDLRYWRRDRLSGLAVQQPYWLTVIRNREAKALWWKRVAQKRVPDHQNQLMKQFVKQNTGHLPDSLATRRMEIMHERIAEDFVYEDDQLWYRNADQSLARMGDQVSEERLRDISRYDLYAKLANYVAAPYSTAYVLDRRIGRMNDHWMTAMWDNEFLFGFRDTRGMMWMHPKRTRYGWYADELPFYWQGSEALLMDLDHLMRDYPSPPLFVDLPTTEDAVNMRATEYDFDVDLERADATGKVRAFLSGQFSTLGRAAYLGAAIDSTVDPRYGHRAIDVPFVRSNGAATLEASSQPPFRFRAEQPLRVDQLVTSEKDGSYSMDLSGFIAHVVPTNFHADTRDLPFYWDFEQRDRAIIDLHFAQPLEVMDVSALQQQVATPHARYTITVHNINAKHIRIESLLEVDGEREEVDAALAVEALCKAAAMDRRVLHLRAPTNEP